MSVLRRTTLAIGAVSFVALAGYMVASLAHLPDRVPMQFDADNEPTWFASPATFYAWMLALWLGTNGALFAARRHHDVAAIGFGLINVVLLLIFHLIYQQATDGDFLRVSPNLAVLALAPVWLAVIVGGIRYKLTRHRHAS